MTRTFVITLALLATMIPRPAQGQLFREWFVCGGGDAFQTCGAVQVTVGNESGGVRPVMLRMWNASGYQGTWANSLFTAIGFFDDYGRDKGGVSVVSGSETMSGPTRGTDTPGAWIARSDVQVGSGIWLELAGESSPGVNNSIASGCADALPGGPELWMNPCYDGTFSDAGWVTLAFEVKGDFDPNDYELLIKAQSGPTGQSMECITGTGDKANCRPPTDVVPEPVTTVLLGSGLAAMAAARRRKKKRGELPEVI